MNIVIKVEGEFISSYLIILPLKKDSLTLIGLNNSEIF